MIYRFQMAAKWPISLGFILILGKTLKNTFPKEIWLLVEDNEYKNLNFFFYPL